MRSLALTTVWSLLLSCAHFEWRQPDGHRLVLPEVSEHGTVVGSGLRYSLTGWQPRACLESFDTVTAGGVPHVETIRVDASFSSREVDLERFVRDGLERTEGHWLTRPDRPPLSFLVTVRVSGQTSDIVEEKAEFGDWVWVAYRRDGLRGFFETCGTHVVRSATFESTAFLLLSYFPNSTKEAEHFEDIADRIVRGPPEDGLQLGLFDQLSLDAATLYATRIDTGRAVGPVDFTFRRLEGLTVSDAIAQLVGATHNAGRGRLVSYQAVPWRRFGDGRLLVGEQWREPGSPEAREATFRVIEELGAWVHEAWLAARRIDLWWGSSDDADACGAMLNPLRHRLSPEDWEACAQQGFSALTVNLQTIAACRPFVLARKAMESTPGCQRLMEATLDTSDPWLHANTYEPLELWAHQRMLWATRDTEVAHQESDEGTFLSGPPVIELGTTMDRSGRFYSDACIEHVEEEKDPWEDADIPEEMREEMEEADTDVLEPAEPEAWSQCEWDCMDDEPEAEEEKEEETETGTDAAEEESSGPSPLQTIVDDKKQDVKEGVAERVGDAIRDELGPGAGDLVADNVEDEITGDEETDASKGHDDILGEEGDRSLDADSDPTFDPEKLGEEPSDVEKLLADDDEEWQPPLYDPREKGGSLENLYVVQTHQPHGYRSWPWWRRLIFFWRDPPEPRLIYRGVLEMGGVSIQLPAAFRLTAEAGELARTDLPEFFDTCGTHYVSQIRHRRGLVYYFTRGSPNDREISIIPYGVSGEVSGKPEFKPRTVRDFFRLKPMMSTSLEGGEHAIPTMVRLEPWSDYLATMGIVGPGVIEALQ